jgi:hypothetical protein
VQQRPFFEETIMNTNTENQTALAAIDRGLSRIEPSLWVVNRQRTLKAEACTMRAGINVSKTVSLSGAVVAGGVGLLMGATGVALVGGGLGLLAYGAVMVCDVLDTGRFAPVPFMRTGLGERLELMGNADAREQRAEFEAARAAAGARDIAADEELYSNLPEELSKEAMMLLKHSRLVVSLLAQLPTASRDLAYIHMCSMFNAFGDSLTGLSLQRLNDAIAGHVGGNYAVMRPAEIHDYQPPAYQIGGQNFGGLPPAESGYGAIAQVGNTTRLGALDVTASDSPADELSQETLKALKLYVQQPKNLVMVASGGAGKGITLANLCRFRYEANTTFRAIWFDPKNDPDETGYMAHTCVDAIRFSAAKLPAEMVVQKVRDMMNRFNELCAKLPPKTPVWLILDEWYFVLSVLQQHDPAALNEVVGMIRATVSLLDAEHKHIVIVGQSPNLNDLLPGQGGLMSNLNTLCLFKNDSSGIKLLEKAGQTGVMPRAMATSQRLSQAAALSPRNRAVFFGDRLWPAPELVNYGNYDRDKGQHLGREAVVLTETASPKPITQPRDFNPDDIKPTAAARQQIALAYAETNAPAGGVHPKVQKFAEIVEGYFSSNPDRESVGLSQIINGNAKLKKLRAEGRKDAIAKLVREAVTAGLIRADEGESGWTIYAPSIAPADDFDFDF